MANVAELSAEVKLKGAQEATKEVKELTNSFGFLGNAAVGVAKALEFGFKILDAGAKDGMRIAREMDRVSFKTGIGSASFQKLDQVFKQHDGNVNSLISSYRNLQQRQAQWKFMGGIGQTEGRALGMLGIDPSQYGNTMDLLKAITDSLLKISDIGERNMLAGILGIDEDFLRVAEKGNYRINELLILSKDEQKTLNDWEQNINNLSQDFDNMFIKLGTMVLAGPGKDFTNWLVDIDHYLSNAVGHAQDMHDVLDNLGGSTEDRNWFGRIVDFFDDWGNVTYDIFSGKGFDYAEKDVEKQRQIRAALRNKRMSGAPVAWQTKNLITPQETRRNGEYLMNRLMAAGYNRSFAAALVGGLTAESRLNPLISGDRGTSFGIAQWHNTRSNGLPGNLEGQADFLIKELVNSFGMTPNRANKMNFVQASDWAIETFENPLDKSENERKRRRKLGLPYLSDNALDPATGRFSDLAQNQMMNADNRNVTVNINNENNISANNLDKSGIVDISEDSFSKSIQQAGQIIS